MNCMLFGGIIIILCLIHIGRWNHDYELASTHTLTLVRHLWCWLEHFVSIITVLLLRIKLWPFCLERWFYHKSWLSILSRIQISPNFSGHPLQFLDVILCERFLGKLANIQLNIRSFVSAYLCIRHDYWLFGVLSRKIYIWIVSWWVFICLRWKNRVINILDVSCFSFFLQLSLLLL